MNFKLVMNNRGFTLVESVLALFIFALIQLLFVFSYQYFIQSKEYLMNNGVMQGNIFASKMNHYLESEAIVQVNSQSLWTQVDAEGASQIIGSRYYYEHCRNCAAGPLINKPSSGGGYHPLIIGIHPINYIQSESLLILEGQFTNGQKFYHETYDR